MWERHPYSHPIPLDIMLPSYVAAPIAIPTDNTSAGAARGEDSNMDTQTPVLSRSQP